MKFPGVTQAMLVATLLLVVALATGCGSAHTSASPTPVTVASTAAPQTSPASVAAPPSAAIAANDLIAINAQLNNLDTELGRADTGLSTQEGDPTK
jgi:hypothetical protein